jgi:hypothetical protein
MESPRATPGAGDAAAGSRLQARQHAADPVPSPDVRVAGSERATVRLVAPERQGGDPLEVSLDGYIAARNGPLDVASCAPAVVRRMSAAIRPEGG